MKFITKFTLLALLILALVFLNPLKIYFLTGQINCGICIGQSFDTSIRKDGKLDFLRADGSIITSINIEIAEIAASREIGLMGRELSNFSGGMLFVYQDIKPRNFWMCNTPTSLDIIFIGEDLYVINIALKTTPMSDQIYSSKVPVKYVVEVKAGFVERYGIKEGTKIRWERLRK